MKPLLLLLLAVSRLAWGGITVSASSTTTGLMWQSDWVPGLGGTSQYTPISLTVSGATGTVSWKFTDQNGNDVSPKAAPSAPSTTVVAGTDSGANHCTNNTCFVRISFSYAWESSAGGNFGNNPSPQGDTQWSPELTVAVPAGDLLVVNAPANPGFAFGWNVAVATTSGKECQVNSVPIMFGANWTEAISGLTCNGAGQNMYALDMPDLSMPFGSISNSNQSPSSPCGTSCTNVFYYAPTAPPSSPIVIVTAIDSGTGTSASVTINFQFPFNLQEWWVHNARMRGLKNIPWGAIQLSSSPLIWQPDLLFYNCQSVKYTTGTGREEQTCGPLPEMALVRDSNNPGGPSFPSSAGSSINRPTWTYNGKWFTYSSVGCHAGFCSTNNDSYFVIKADGSTNSIINATSNLPIYTPSYYVGDWIFGLDSSSTKIIADNLAPLDSGLPFTTFTLLNPLPTPTCSPACGAMSMFSQVVGHYLMVKPKNAISCDATNTAPCTNAGTWYTFDMSNCEQNSGAPQANCGGTPAGSTNPAGSFNLALQATGFFDCSGNAHDQIGTGGVGGEYRTHDSYMEPGSVAKNGLPKCIWNYGSFSNPGEVIFFEVNCFDGSGLIEKYPAFATPGVPYQSHPAFGWSGSNLSLYGGAGNQNTTTPGSSCTNTGTSGGYLWDYRTNTSMGGDYIAALGATNFGHSAWDGFDSNYALSDMHLVKSDPVSGITHGVDMESFLPASASLGRTTFGAIETADSGGRALNNNGTMYPGILGPTQSPDGTKYGNTGPAATAAWERSYGWIQRTRTPQPPAGLTLMNNTGTMGFWPNSLNREIRRYWVYKQPSCTGAWGDPIVSVAASYESNFLPHVQYTFTDSSPLTAGQTACYGATSEEWAGMQGVLSNTIQLTNAGGVFSAIAKSAPGTMNFDSVAPGNITSLSIASQKLCQSTSDCHTVDTPTSPTVTNASGGSVAGTFSAKVVYCKFSDFPANKVPNCTLPSAASTSVSITGTISIESSSGDPTGHDAAQFYASSDGINYHLQTCRLNTSTGWVVPTFNGGTYLMSMFENLTGSQFFCLVDSFNSTSALPPNVNMSAAGYKLTWTESTSSDAREYQIYYSEGAAPIFSQGEAAAQAQLIATIPAGHGVQSSQYFDYLANLGQPSTNVFYGIVAKDHAGNRSGGACMRGDGTGVSCN